MKYKVKIDSQIKGFPVNEGEVIEFDEYDRFFHREHRSVKNNVRVFESLPEDTSVKADYQFMKGKMPVRVNKPQAAAKKAPKSD